VDESALEFESPAATALRLAQEKAFAVACRFPDAVVIGSDQVASCGGRRLEKPLTKERAFAQLVLQRGRESIFHTAVCVMTQGGQIQTSEVVTVKVVFRSEDSLTDAHLRRYIDLESPLDCAGSAKSEGLGVALMESLTGPDPTALIGLPMIALTRLLRDLGIDPLVDS
jgi:septum formation protein